MQNLSEQIILKITKTRFADQDKLDDIVRSFLRARKGKKSIPAKSDLLQSYHKLLRAGKVVKNAPLEKLLTKRAVRTLSGVAPLTVLTKPYPCPGKCVYCPTEARMPKSYLSDEPAAARALGLKFSPFNQVVSRLQTLAQNGHPTDKIELIVKGGTWNAYTLPYQFWYILECFRAANNTHGKPRAEKKFNLEKIKIELVKEQKKNETARHRIIGLTLETRPDCVNETTVRAMRAQGATRIEMGVQTTDEKTLRLIKRGHDVAAVKTATTLLKNYGFKVDYHLMPQLPGATPARDLKMLNSIFSNPSYRPDMVKIYPCTVVKNSELFDWIKTGKYKTYSTKQLVEMLIKFKTTVPRYVRISRLIRDIPAHHIHAGNIMTNLRQVIQSEMKTRGLVCNCLRCREVGHQEISKVNPPAGGPKLFIDKYEASGGTEYFLSWEDKNRQVVFGFCRLRLDAWGFYPAFIRELHTYGQMLAIGKKNKDESQHTGLGKKLLIEAEKICQKNKIETIAVIAGVGVRDYYRHLGYHLENGYMVKNLK